MTHDGKILIAAVGESVAFLDSQKAVNKNKKIGTQGYCMGGALVMRIAAAIPDRIGAGASFHGGGLVTDQPSSPHLLIPRMKARLYIAVASNVPNRNAASESTESRTARRSSIRVSRVGASRIRSDSPVPRRSKTTRREKAAMRSWNRG